MISVAMATYNGAKYIIAQLNSIYDQKMRPDEVVIVDDCSTDSTLETIREWVADKSDVIWKVCKNEANQGYVKTFFKAISQTSGDIIILCDQDDVWTNDKVTEIHNAFDNSDVLSYHSDIDIIDQDGNELKSHVIGYTDYNAKYSTYNFLHRLNYCGMSSAFRSSLKADLIKINPEKIPTHDWVIHALSSVKDGLFVSNKVTTCRRYHVDNAALIMEKPKREKIKQRIEVVDKYKFYYKLYLSLLEKYGNGDSASLGVAKKYFDVTSKRLNYLKKRSIFGFLRNFFATKYYSSTKAYFCDLLYMVGFF